MSFGRRYRPSYGSYGSGYDPMAMLREMEQKRRMTELLRAAGNSERRKTEARVLGRFTPAGVWDADCEAWPAQNYTLDLGGGFVARTMRNTVWWSWCGYVKLPAWYPGRAQGYEFWNRKTPRAPVHKEFSYSRDGELGWDHTWGGDLCPLGKPVDGSDIGPNWGPHARYTTLEMVKEECIAVAAWFASLALNGQVVVPADVLEANRASLVAVQQRHEAIKERRRAEKAAKEAAEKAEAERKAAEEAERQRLWDLEHPLEAALRNAKLRAATAEKAATAALARAHCAARYASEVAEALEVKKSRLPHVQEVLAEIAELEKRETAGERLSAAERRKMNRKEQLGRELANCAGHSERYKEEEKKLMRLRAEADAAEEAAAPARAAVEAAQAEVGAAEAAIAKRDADAQAEEEARIAAAKRAQAEKEAAKKAAAEREHATKRLAHVVRLIAQVEAIRARKEAGDKTLDTLQLKKAARLGDLLKEKAALEAFLA